MFLSRISSYLKPVNAQFLPIALERIRTIEGLFLKMLCWDTNNCRITALPLACVLQLSSTRNSQRNTGVMGLTSHDSELEPGSGPYHSLSQSHISYQSSPFIPAILSSPNISPESLNHSQPQLGSPHPRPLYRDLSDPIPSPYPAQAQDKVDHYYHRGPTPPLPSVSDEPSHPHRIYRSLSDPLPSSPTPPTRSIRQTNKDDDPILSPSFSVSPSSSQYDARLGEWLREKYPPAQRQPPREPLMSSPNVPISEGCDPPKVASHTSDRHGDGHTIAEDDENIGSRDPFAFMPESSYPPQSQREITMPYDTMSQWSEMLAHDRGESHTGTLDVLSQVSGRELAPYALEGDGFHEDIPSLPSPAIRRAHSAPPHIPDNDNNNAVLEDVRFNTRDPTIHYELAITPRRPVKRTRSSTGEDEGAMRSAKRLRLRR